jgi:hypothetical protein
MTKVSGEVSVLVKGRLCGRVASRAPTTGVTRPRPSYGTNSATFITCNCPVRLVLAVEQNAWMLKVSPARSCIVGVNDTRSSVVQTTRCDGEWFGTVLVNETCPNERVAWMAAHCNSPEMAQIPSSGMVKTVGAPLDDLSRYHGSSPKDDQSRS